MENVYDIKREARRQYLKFFGKWFIAVGILAVITAILIAEKTLGARDVRTNSMSPEERVYDMADVLTDQEEQQLRELIARTERQIHCDIVLVTINQPVEGYDLPASYGYRYSDWDGNMMDLADDFYDGNSFGYNGVHGDGALLLDNWYEGQKGSWLSTCGRVLDRFGYEEIDRLLDEVYKRVDISPYRGYKAYVEYIGRTMGGINTRLMGQFWVAAVIISTIVSAVFIFSNLKSKEGEKTVAANTYVAEGKPAMNQMQDDFIRKSVTTRRIQRNSGGGGGGHHSGGGHHVSRGGVSHGGGGRRR